LVGRRLSVRVRRVPRAVVALDRRPVVGFLIRVLVELRRLLDLVFRPIDPDLLVVPIDSVAARPAGSKTFFPKIQTPVSTTR
jgi:hypothetical protein